MRQHSELCAVRALVVLILGFKLIAADLTELLELATKETSWMQETRWYASRVTVAQHSVRMVASSRLE